MKHKLFLLSALVLMVMASGCKKEDPQPEPTPDPTPVPTETLSDVCGNTYNAFTIGTQIWMAENMRCDKYDTESEAVKDGITSISTSKSAVYTAYYADAADKTKWKDAEYAASLSAEQIAKLGYLYNWAAAVGLADGKSRSAAFIGDRQGICPNGWHVPTYSELDALANYIDGQVGDAGAGKKLKTTSGWHNGGNGTDDYGFSALPAGAANGDEISSVGVYANFCSATPYSAENVYYKSIASSGDNVSGNNATKSFGMSVRCVKGKISEDETLSVTPTYQTVEGTGDSFDITITSNTYWTASSNQTWATLSETSSYGNRTIKVSIEENSSENPDFVLISITTQSGSRAEVQILRKGLTAKDICGNTYKVVTIAGRLWMAENMRCNKYDTESEAYKEGRLTIPTSAKSAYTAYYTDGSNKNLWNDGSKNTTGVGLSSEQIAKLGYLYNWAAAVGLAESVNEDVWLKGFRQGICPNGWHVPDTTQYQYMNSYICQEKKVAEKLGGKYLKSKSGWYDNQNGTDAYGFDALPAGGAVGETVVSVGNWAGFWTKSCCPNRFIKYSAMCASFYASGNSYHNESGERNHGYSVRCQKDW